MLTGHPMHQALLSQQMGIQASFNADLAKLQAQQM